MRGWQPVAGGGEGHRQAFLSPTLGEDLDRNGTTTDRTHGSSVFVSFPPLLRTLRAGASAWRWLERRRSAQIAARRLRITETLSLGEKRFVSILEVEGMRYLIGGSADTIQLLATLQGQEGTDSAITPGREELS